MRGCAWKDPLYLASGSDILFSLQEFVLNVMKVMRVLKVLRVLKVMNVLRVLRGPPDGLCVDSNSVSAFPTGREDDVGCLLMYSAEWAFRYRIVPTGIKVL